VTEATKVKQFTIDIDTGGTFTDGFFSDGDRFETVKTDTTPHDLTVCFNKCVVEGAKRFGFENVSDFLRQTKTIRFSTTVGTNALIQKTGPKIGLIVTKGYEDTLYQEQENPVLDYIIDREMVIGLEEDVSESGEVIKAASNEDIRQATKQLLEKGARAFVVSLKNAHVNNENERLVRDVLYEDYPRHYLGTKTIQLGSQISSRVNNGIRTNAAVVNAYLHRDLVKYLYKADDQMRQQAFTNPLLIAHANGGVARVAKTKAIDTYNSGPAAGLMGSKYIGDLYGLDNILSIDIGGTSSDIGIIADSELTFDTESSIANIPVHTPLIQVDSIGGGGGSIAKVTSDGELQLGPESAGSVPGPACYDLGGTKPTVTDASVVLGLLDPDFYLNGTKQISKEKAVEAIQKWIAEPLEISVEEAAVKILDKLEEVGAEKLKEVVEERNRSIDRFKLFSFGGGGGLFSAGIAKKSGINQVYSFPFSSVFSAFGLSTAAVVHNYQERMDFHYKENETTTEIKALAKPLIEKMEKLAHRDMRGEGFRANDVQYNLSIEAVSADGRKREIFTLPNDFLADQSEHKVKEALNEAAKELNSKEITVEFIRLNSHVIVSDFELPKLEKVSEAPKPKSVRDIYWREGPQETNVYDMATLQPGQTITGPAVLESPSTSIAVPKGATFQMDEHLNGIMEVE